MPVDVFLKLKQKVNNCPICITENMGPEGWVWKGQIKGKEETEHSQQAAVLDVTRTTWKEKMTLRVGIPFEGESNSQVYDPE